MAQLTPGLLRHPHSWSQHGENKQEREDPQE